MSFSLFPLSLTGQTVAAAAGKTLVIFPLALYGDPAKAYLSQGIRSMLISRLSGGGINILADEAPDPFLSEKEKQGVIRKPKAEEATRSLGADYAIFGSITTVGTGYSLDLTLIELKGGGVRTSNISEAVQENELITKIADVAYQFRGFAEGRDIRAERMARASGPSIGGGGGGGGGLFSAPEQRTTTTPDLRPAGNLSIKFAVFGFDAGDLDGDKVPEWVVLGHARLLVYKKKGKVMVSSGLLKPAGGEAFLSVSVGDGDGDGRAEIYVVSLYGGMARTTVLAWPGKFERLYRRNGQLRVIKYPGQNSPMLLLNNTGINELLVNKMSVMTYGSNGKLTEKESLSRLRKAQFRTLTPYDFNRDGILEYIGLDMEYHKLRIWDNEGKIRWNGQKRLGGSNNAFWFADPADTERDEFHERLNSRLVLGDIDKDGKKDVVAIQNVPTSRYLEDADYIKGRLTAYTVQGLGLKPSWTSRELKYTITDIQLDDGIFFVAAQKVKLTSIREGTGGITWFK